MQNHYDSALCENEAGALSANQNAGLQCKINSANQGVVECCVYAGSGCDLRGVKVQMACCGSFQKEVQFLSLCGGEVEDGYKHSHC